MKQLHVSANVSLDNNNYNFTGLYKIVYDIFNFFRLITYMYLCVVHLVQVDRYLRKLDQELSKFKMELEADHAGITEVLEKSNHLFFQKKVYSETCPLRSLFWAVVCHLWPIFKTNFYLISYVTCLFYSKARLIRTANARKNHANYPSMRIICAKHVHSQNI